MTGTGEATLEVKKRAQKINGAVKFTHIGSRTLDTSRSPVTSLHSSRTHWFFKKFAEHTRIYRDVTRTGLFHLAAQFVREELTKVDIANTADYQPSLSHKELVRNQPHRARKK